MIDPTETEVPAEGATPAADLPEADGLAAEMAQMRERLASYEAAEAQRQREQEAADKAALDDADALTRVQAEREQLQAELAARDGVLAELAKSQVKGLALDAGTKALLKGLAPKDQLAWIAAHGASYRRDAAPATRTAAGAAVDYAQMAAQEVQMAMVAEMRKHKVRSPQDIAKINPALWAAYRPSVSLH